MTKNTFIKAERLTGKTTIDQLFSGGKSFFCYPYRIAFRVLDEKESERQDYPCRVLVNVPKRLHKTAVARNLLKRRIKEAYRLDKSNFYTTLEGTKIQLAILYSSRDVLAYDEVSVKLQQALQQLSRRVAKSQVKAEDR